MPFPILIHTCTPLQAHACAATVNFAEGVEEEVRAGQGGGGMRALRRWGAAGNLGWGDMHACMHASDGFSCPLLPLPCCLLLPPPHSSPSAPPPHVGAQILPPYLDTLITKLLTLLQHGKKLVQEAALTAMASMADCSKVWIHSVGKCGGAWGARSWFRRPH